MGTVNLLECVRHTDSVRSVVNITTDKIYKNKERCWEYRENEELDGMPRIPIRNPVQSWLLQAIKIFLYEAGIAVSTARAGMFSDRIIPDYVRAIKERKDIVVRNPYSVRLYQHALELIAVY